MKLQGRKLTFQDAGDDVAALNDELGQLGYDIPVGDLDQRLFGEKTRAAVTEFQSKHNLPQTGGVDDATATEINRALKAQSAQAPVRLEALAQTLHLDLPQPLRDRLAERQIHTLEDMQAAGGFAAFENLADDATKALLEKLASHAALSPISGDSGDTEKLIESGFRDPTAIAREPRDLFVHSLRHELGESRAAAIHDSASAQTAFLNNIIVAHRADAVNRLSHSVPDALTDAQPAECECEDWQSAVSPHAYLIDLLSYALTHIKLQQEHGLTGEYYSNYFEKLLDSHVDPAIDLNWDEGLDAFSVRWTGKIHTRYSELYTFYTSVAGWPRAQVKLWIDDRLLIDGVIDQNPEEFSAALSLDTAHRYDVEIEYFVENHHGAASVRLSWASASQPKEVVPGTRLYADALQNISLDFLSNMLHQPLGTLPVTRDSVEKTLPQVRLCIEVLRDYLHGLKAEYFHDLNLGNRALTRIDPVLNFDWGIGSPDPAIKPDQFSARWLGQVLPRSSEPYTFRTVSDDGVRLWVNGQILIDNWTEHPPTPDSGIIDLEAGKRCDLRMEYFEKGGGAVIRLSWSSPSQAEEVIPRHRLLPLEPAQGAVLDEAERRYRFDAYTTLLTRLGTSYDELRRARKAKPEAQKSLAEKLGIDVGHLEELFLEAAAVSEQALEQLFGLVGTTRDPLASASRPGLEQWRVEYLWSLWKQQDWPDDGYSKGTLPVVDPDMVDPTDLRLPSPHPALEQLLATRSGLVAKDIGDFQTDRETNGLAHLLTMVLGNHNLDELLEKLRKGVDPEDTKRTIIEVLGLTLGSFTRLMEIRAKDVLNDPQQAPTEREWLELYSILAQVRKVKRYPDWTTEERYLGIELGPWLFWIGPPRDLRKWLADLDARQAWEEALRTRSRPPLIDPDVISLDDLIPVDNNPVRNAAKNLLAGRQALLQEISNQLRELRRNRTPLEGLNATIGSAIEASLDYLVALQENRNLGQKISWRLEQLGLTNESFAYLLQIGELARENHPILESEWADVENLLTAVKKRRLFGQWRKAERALGLILSPDPFIIPPGDVAERPLTKWRATPEARRAWQDILRSRTEQKQAVIDGIAAAVRTTEEAALPVLRDALVVACSAEGMDLETKARWLADRLLIDTQVGGCQQTTRVAQAIETTQGLLWAVRTGQLARAHPELVLRAGDFDEEWRWLGSYAAWKAAMLVFLYPENILLPTLRRRQTEAFRKLAADLRQGMPTPESAWRAANAYADYFRDVCSLKLESCATARIRARTEPRRDSPVAAERELVFLFARCTVSRKVYWSTLDPKAPGDFAQSFWMELQDLGEVLNLIGAAVYEPSADKRWIHLFARIQTGGAQKLVFSSYDLNAGVWKQGPAELGLPDKNATSFTSRLRKVNPEAPPRLAIWLPDGRLYDCSLGPEGSEWKSKEPVYFAQWKDIPESELPLKATAEFFTWMRGVHEYAKRKGFASGFPNFHEADYGQGRVFGSYLLRSDVVEQRIVTAAELGTSPRAPALERFGALHSYAVQQGFAGGYPTYAEEFLGSEFVVILVKSFAAESRWVKAPLLGNIDELKNFDVLFRAVNDYAFRNGYVAGIPFGDRGPGNDTEFGFILIRPDSQAEVLLEPWQPDCKYGNIAPKYNGPFEITERLSDVQLEERARNIAETVAANKPGPRSNLVYFEEAWYFVPLQIALQLRQRGHYTAALDWLRTLYNYTVPEPRRKIYGDLELEPTSSGGLYREEDWLLDPLNPHHIAGVRASSYSRYTLLALIRCLLDYADAEFTRDTSESNPRARTLYATALQLLDTSELKQALSQYDDLLIGLETQLGVHSSDPLWHAARHDLSCVRHLPALKKAVKEIGDALEAAGSHLERLWAARQIAAQAASAMPHSSDVAALLEKQERSLVRFHASLSASRAFAAATRRFRLLAMGHDGQVTAAGDSPHPSALARISALSRISFTFCVPPNPILRALRLHADLNLYKLRACRNIAGMQRQLEPYAAPLDVKSGLPAIGGGGQLVLPGAAQIRPTPYRYKVLIERAKQFVQIATQIEAAMLSALEKRDAEAYNLLKARQDLRLSRAGVRLQDLRIQEAEDGITLAALQEERDRIEENYYGELLGEGISVLESLALGSMANSAALLMASAGYSFYTGLVGLAAGLSSTAQALGTTASIFSTFASYERRKQEWEFHRQFAQHNMRISAQQTKIARDRVRIVSQERTIAEMQSDHAQAVVEFLSNKFANAELYDWMGEVLERVYRYFLEQATAMAKLAENQLAFERQITPPAFIEADYWEIPAEGSAIDAQGPDRRGLTGSARLLQDIHQLEQFEFETNKRKLQLTTTISLATLKPDEFQRFRETGVLRLRTPMEMFDREFPGHYLRLIRKVRTSVIALIPPSRGIRATLATSGASQVVVGGELFQPVLVRRDPESVALTSPRDATGLFELEPQSEMLFPFEAMGVDTNWEFRMPKAANPFDYGTIADILVTIDYTALHSFDFEQNVIRKLGGTVSADQPFSFRNQFADAWYELHNPERSEREPMTVTFETTRGDFPPNVEDLSIQHLVLFFVSAGSKPFEVQNCCLLFKEETGGTLAGGYANTIEGKISTRLDGPASWNNIRGKNTVGEWELTLPNDEDFRSRFKNEVMDILLVVTHSGRPPDWPS